MENKQTDASINLGCRIIRPFLKSLSTMDCLCSQRLELIKVNQPHAKFAFHYSWPLSTARCAASDSTDNAAGPACTILYTTDLLDNSQSVKYIGQTTNST